MCFVVSLYTRVKMTKHNEVCQATMQYHNNSMQPWLQPPKQCQQLENLRCVPALIPREHEFFNDNMAGLLAHSNRSPWGLPTRFLAVTEFSRKTASDNIGENTAAGSAQDSHLCSLFSHQWSGCSQWPPHYQETKVYIISHTTKFSANEHQTLFESRSYMMSTNYTNYTLV